MTVNAQKPVLQLIPVNRSLPPTEIAADTINTLRDQPASRFVSDSCKQADLSSIQKEPDKEERRRTGMSLPSLFKKRVDVPEDRPQRPIGIPLFFKYIHPFQLFFQITAQK
jgi:hypothetical protein